MCIISVNPNRTRVVVLGQFIRVANKGGIWETGDEFIFIQNSVILARRRPRATMPRVRVMYALHPHGTKNHKRAYPELEDWCRCVDTGKDHCYALTYTGINTHMNKIAEFLSKLTKPT